MSAHREPGDNGGAEEGVSGCEGCIGTRARRRECKECDKEGMGGIGNLSIGIGGYNFDAHNSERLACRNNTGGSSSSSSSSSSGGGSSSDTGACLGKSNGFWKGNYAWNEGDVETSPGLYQIPVWVMFPKRTESTNLLVVAAPSATHVGMSTLRMEPQFMMIGQAAGAVAYLSIKEGKKVQDVDVGKLREKLLSEHVILDLPSSSFEKQHDFFHETII